jgi:hypothetical protein
MIDSARFGKELAKINVTEFYTTKVEGDDAVCVMGYIGNWLKNMKCVHIIRVNSGWFMIIEDRRKHQKNRSMNISLHYAPVFLRDILDMIQYLNPIADGDEDIRDRIAKTVMKIENSVIREKY